MPITLDFLDFFILDFALSNERECKCKTAKVHGDRHIKGAKRLGSERAREREGQGAKRPGSEKARERKFQGANWPGSYWPIRSGERIGPGAKRLSTQSQQYITLLLTLNRSQYNRINFYCYKRNRAYIT